MDSTPLQPPAPRPDPQFPIHQIPQGPDRHWRTGSGRPDPQFPIHQIPQERIYRPLPQKPKQNVWLHIALYIATIASTTWIHGWQYSACLMLILTCHEFGHYFAAKKHRVAASLPYFIPAPFRLMLFGTMGAVIRMSPYIPTRRALLDIAAAGPIAGIIVALPVTLAGMFMSTLQPKAALTNSLELGDPLMMQMMEWWIFGSSSQAYDVLLHPIALAGWVGMFVTALNLLPIGQLDGGHVIHAVFGKHSKYISWGMYGSLVLMTAFGNPSYMLFLVLLWFMGVKHPPTLNDAVPLDRRRKGVAIVLLIIFILCFTPSPIQS